MRKILLFICLLVSLASFSQTVVQMEKTGGVYRVPCEVNGLRMKFIFDTGASVVCLSESMADFMLENGYLKKEDIVGTSKARVADGRLVDNIKIILRDIEISGMHLKNVDAVVSSGQSAPLLLGQSAIQKLGAVTIDGDKLVINTMSDADRDKLIEKLDRSADINLKNGSYEAAIDDLLKIEEMCGLSATGLADLCVCYRFGHDYSNCIKRCDEWLKKYEHDEKCKDDRPNIYLYLGKSYDELNNAEKSILYYQKALNDNISEIDRECSYFFIGYQMREKEDWYNADIFMGKSIESHYKRTKSSENKVMSGIYKDELLGETFYSKAVVCYNLNDMAGYKKYCILGAKCGNELAIEKCKLNGYDYKTNTRTTPARTTNTRTRKR